MFIEMILPLSSSSSVRSGIDFWFAMSLLTELEESKGSVSYKHFAPSGAGGISSLPIQDEFSTQVHSKSRRDPKPTLRAIHNLDD